ncbi:Wzz/FepE/Etk N-terminal domain-containing protein [Nocardioides sp. YIM 152588]|uniref:YveK family protein n=1 Tax=Nocardioides sp. YIM 152588 TaxID=3158259 RepID=UPI0032E4E9C7
MPTETTAPPTRGPIARALQHRLPLIGAFALIGLVAGLLYALSLPAAYTSTTRVLINPAVGNPFVPTPSAVRQDELTSLETEAQVARSAEVLGPVAERAGLDLEELGRRVSISVPPNTQILEIVVTMANSAAAQQTAEDVAATYLKNRADRAESVNEARLEQVESRIREAVADLRAASEAALTSTGSDRAFQAHLATALRNELVNLRSQQTALEDTASTGDSVITPATVATASTNVTTFAAPVIGLLAGLVVGCLLALVLERSSGKVRSVAEVRELGVAVAAAVPVRRHLLRRRRAVERRRAFDATVRRLRATILALEPRPAIVAVAGAGHSPSDPGVAEAVAASFAKAGHSVVLVKTDGAAAAGLAVEDGFAQALLHERLDVLELLQPSSEPLLCLLPAGEVSPHSQELVITARVRDVLTGLVEAGYLVVVEAPGLDTVEGEAIVGAADLGLVVIATGETLVADVEALAARGADAPEAMVVDGGYSPHDAGEQHRPSHRDHDDWSADEAPANLSIDRRR